MTLNNVRLPGWILVLKNNTHIFEFARNVCTYSPVNFFHSECIWVEKFYANFAHSVRIL